MIIPTSLKSMDWICLCSYRPMNSAWKKNMIILPNYDLNRPMKCKHGRYLAMGDLDHYWWIKDIHFTIFFWIHHQINFHNIEWSWSYIAISACSCWEPFLSLAEILVEMIAKQVITPLQWRSRLLQKIYIYTWLLSTTFKPNATNQAKEEYKSVIVWSEQTEHPQLLEGS
jgi:hypothetical protein